MITIFKDVQFSKVWDSIDFIDKGISIFFNNEHLLKAWHPIKDADEGICFYQRCAISKREWAYFCYR